MRLHRNDLRKSPGELQSTSESLRKLTRHGGRRMVFDDRQTILTCQFIQGQPTKLEIRKYGSDRFKCSKPTQPGSCYCPDCHAICYVKALTADEQSPASNDDGTEPLDY